MSATENELGNLHTKVAQVMLDSLERLDIKLELPGDEDDVLVSVAQEPNPALLNVITKFLKDNEITCSSGQGSTADALREKLDQRKRMRAGNTSHE